MKIFYHLDLFSLPYSFNKAENFCSAFLSFLVLITFLIITVYTAYYELYNRKIYTITYLGKQHTNTINNISVNVTLGVTYGIKSQCAIFYKDGDNDSVTFVQQVRNVVYNLTVNFTTINSKGNYFDRTFYMRCQRKEDYLLYADFTISLNYSSSRNSLLDIDMPVSFYDEYYNNQVNSRQFYDAFTPKLYSARNYKLNYYQNNIIDDTSFIFSEGIYSKNLGRNFISLDRMTVSEFLESLPTESVSPDTDVFPPIKIFSLEFSLDKDSQTTLRRFTTIPSILANAVGIFSTMRFGSYVLLLLLNNYTKEFQLYNKAFSIKSWSGKESENDSLLSKSNKFKFNCCDNLVFAYFCCLKTKRMRMKQKMFYHLRRLTLEMTKFHNILALISAINAQMNIKDKKLAVLVNESKLTFETSFDQLPNNSAKNLNEEFILNNFSDSPIANSPNVNYPLEDPPS
jgi:hypothetical protein